MREGRKTGFVRHLRRTMTDAERSIWHHLRNRAFMGCKFRRQHAIGAYVVDFVCLERRLVVELDGGQHADDIDENRDKALQDMGFRVLRFWDNAALADQQTVLAAIFEALDCFFPAAAKVDKSRPPT